MILRYYKMASNSSQVPRTLLSIMTIRLQESAFQYKPKGYADVEMSFETWLCSQESLKSNPWRVEDEYCDGTT
jgi:hypothetical protein